ncbi:Inositol phosphatase [Carpediemonas membranifera]|uniref:Inositol phosphatase n=1 Tax=Carpediemonas membranifera TaxID=201153 RepID=A0A8J6E2L1_9EUKA|nr:Inositol phosphatase [Carpediemonas membranifera]|eukprot:KAG9392032.1 Inositol phosphatase [Carpediemonas membranifera]
MHSVRYSTTKREFNECVLAGDVVKLADMLGSATAGCTPSAEDIEVIEKCKEEIATQQEDNELYIKGYVLQCINQYNKVSDRVAIFTDAALYHIKTAGGAVKRSKRFPFEDVAYVHYGSFHRERDHYGVKVVMAEDKPHGDRAKLYLVPTEVEDGHSMAEEIAQVLNCLLRAAKGAEGLGLVNQNTLTRPGRAGGIQRVVSDTVKGRLGN